MQNPPDYGEQSYRGADKLKGKTAIIAGGKPLPKFSV